MSLRRTVFAIVVVALVATSCVSAAERKHHRRAHRAHQPPPPPPPPAAAPTAPAVAGQNPGAAAPGTPPSGFAPTGQVVNAVNNANPLASGPVQQPVLWIGDSHTAGVFGHEAYDRLKVPFPQLYQYGRSGWRSANYMSGRGLQKPIGGSNRFPPGSTGPLRPTNGNAPVRLADLMNAEPKPKTCIAALGANEIGSAAGAVDIVQQFKAARCRCIWIGPPRTGERNALYKVHALENFYADLTRRIGNDCTIIRSYGPGAPFVPTYTPTGGDGLHYDGTPDLKKIGKEWGEKVADAIKALR